MAKKSSNKTIHKIIGTVNCIVCNTHTDTDSKMENICSKCWNDVFGNETEINSCGYIPAVEL